MIDGSDYVVASSIDQGLQKILGIPFHLTGLRGFTATQGEAFIQCFDVATTTSVTLGTTLPQAVVHMTTDGVTEGDGLPTTSGGVYFRNGLTAVATTNPLGATPATVSVHVDVYFK